MADTLWQDREWFESFDRASGFQCPLRLRVLAAFLAERERAAAGRLAEALPPSLPPLWAEGWLEVLPRPLPPGFLPPLSSLLTVAQARRSASFLGTPRFS